MTDAKYVLTMNSEQAHTALKAVELLMRLKINQPREISRAVMPEDYWDEKTGKVDTERFDDFIRRRDQVDSCAESAFLQMFPTWEHVKKDAEWYRLYNLYQAIRYQIHLAEHPDSLGVDSYPPLQMTDEPIPDCRIRKPMRVVDVQGKKVCPHCRYVLDGKKARPYCEMCGTELVWKNCRKTG